MTGTGNYMDSLENLLTALEIYRDVEQQTVNRIKEIMSEHNILIPAPEVVKVDTEEIRARLAANKQMQMVAEPYLYGAEDGRAR